MTTVYFGFFMKIKTTLSSQEIHELLQISRIMISENGAACICFVFLFTGISVTFCIIPSCSERDNGNCQEN